MSRNSAESLPAARRSVAPLVCFESLVVASAEPPSVPGGDPARSPGNHYVIESRAPAAGAASARPALVLS